MADLISRAAAIDAICGCFNIMEAQGVDMTVARAIVKSALDNAPAVDAEPVRHGRWVEDEKAYPGPDLSNYVCSSCKRVGGTWIKCLKPENLFTYCPWCGAKMDG